ncbi:uncharacterized protein LOC126843296 isoform X2 [Adelges cooleyi]|uniref:uncharacterized protein LOC126843296 isoform X2 n=1 Tax=Adelges cooleyi TaxID=133065 RepID=UPI00217F3685|nr:uncharacterized protein LOC126843296 isoform X2 [Adelges cooleyi]
MTSGSCSINDDNIDRIFEPIITIMEPSCTIMRQEVNRQTTVDKPHLQNSSHSRPNIQDKNESLPSIHSLGEENNKDLEIKRKRDPSQWKRNVKKSKRNSGDGKVFVNTDCKCNKHCYRMISENQRKGIFELFWAMSDYKRQNTYICGLIKRYEVKVRRTRDGSRGNKGSTNKYFLNIEGMNLNVCKLFFLQTFAISDGRMSRALQKEKCGHVGADFRGKGPSANKTEEWRVEEVKKHIKSFPAFTSQHTQAHNPNRRYLNPNLNVRLMYTLYKESCLIKQNKPVSENLYRKIFSELNLHFNSPKKDTMPTM